MKKSLYFALILTAAVSSAAIAAQRGTPEYEQLKEYKRQQKAKKEAEKANPSPKAKGFWAKEAERSGLAGTGAMFSNAIGKALPFDAPNSRKSDQ